MQGRRSKTIHDKVQGRYVGAFESKTPQSGTPASLPATWYRDAIFSIDGRYGAYGAPADVKLLKDEVFPPTPRAIVLTRRCRPKTNYRGRSYASQEAIAILSPASTPFG